LGWKKKNFSFEGGPFKGKKIFFGQAKENKKENKKKKKKKGF